MKELLQRTITLIESWMGRDPFPPAFVGFDGFVDKIQKPIRSRAGDELAYYDTIDAYAARLGEAAGKSAQIEMALRQIRLGGNAPITSHALATLGVPTTCMGTLGTPVIHPVFQKMSDRCTAISLGNPAETQALEFRDGVILESDFSTFHQLTWEVLCDQVGHQVLEETLGRSRLIALVDWSNVTHATDIWAGILQEMLPKLPESNRLFFFDLCDPSAKPVREAHRMVELLRAFKAFGTVVLGLNENEALSLSRLVIPKVDRSRLELVVEGLYDRLQVDYLIVHPTDRTFLAGPSGQQEFPNRVIRQKVLLTGAGDNLNAGFCLGQLLHFDPACSLTLARAAAGVYVESGRSGTLPELKKYLEKWLGELEGS